MVATLSVWLLQILQLAHSDQPVCRDAAIRGHGCKESTQHGYGSWNGEMLILFDQKEYSFQRNKEDHKNTLKKVLAEVECFSVGETSDSDLLEYAEDVRERSRLLESSQEDTSEDKLFIYNAASLCMKLGLGDDAEKFMHSFITNVDSDDAAEVGVPTQFANEMKQMGFYKQAFHIAAHTAQQNWASSMDVYTAADLGHHAGDMQAAAVLFRGFSKHPDVAEHLETWLSKPRYVIHEKTINLMNNNAKDKSCWCW